ncbi:MAG: DUF1287 domain-containing protein [Deltaproteobacteria bacterium]|jgi:uncharacterized protein YijF (DUF1287 family)|nr:DUF1287 domain-containing protein [Deltaproteobacteria bacterium]
MIRMRKAAIITLLLAAFYSLAPQAAADLLPWFRPGAYDNIEKIRPDSDKNKNGVNDADDFIVGAKAEADRRPFYRSAYYKGGYPPASEGVCTDVIVRAFAHAGYNLKNMLDADIRNAPASYPRARKPDPNIDYRRVPNQTAFFRRHGRQLSTKIIPGDAHNLKEWQGGDLVIFANPDHIAILSDKRNEQGVPLLLHNQGPWATEGDDFMAWYARGIVAHIRFP